MKRNLVRALVLVLMAVFFLVAAFGHADDRAFWFGWPQTGYDWRMMSQDERIAYVLGVGAGMIQAVFIYETLFGPGLEDITDAVVITASPAEIVGALNQYYRDPANLENYASLVIMLTFCRGNQRVIDKFLEEQKRMESSL